MWSGIYDNRNLFKMALGIGDPWEVEEIKFSAEKERLDIRIRHYRGTKFVCSQCGGEHGIHDTVDRSWRHLNFFQYEAHIHCRVPRTKCEFSGKVKRIEVPWARPGSGFTLLFEAFVMELAKEMAMSVTGGIVGEQDTRLMRVVNHYVWEGRKKVDMSKVKKIGVDETSRKKGHDYVTIVADLEEERILFATEGKDSSTIKKFVDDFKEHGGDPDQIVAASIDLSPAFQKGMQENIPSAEITFDHYHVIGLVNKALDEVRRAEAKDQVALKHSRYWWLKNPQNLKAKQAKGLAKLTQMNLKTARAYRIKLVLQDIYKLKDPELAETALKKWYFWATHSRIPQIIKVAKTIKAHWDGVMNYFKEKITNGLVECFNGIIQTIKRRARGYRNSTNFITMIYLVKGNLDFGLPSVTNLTHSK